MFLRSVLQKKVVSSEVMKCIHTMKLTVLVGDIAVFLEGRNTELPCFAEKVLRAISR